MAPRLKVPRMAKSIANSPRMQHGDVATQPATTVEHHALDAMVDNRVLFAYVSVTPEAIPPADTVLQEAERARMLLWSTSRQRRPVT